MMRGRKWPTVFFLSRDKHREKHQQAKQVWSSSEKREVLVKKEKGGGWGLLFTLLHLLVHLSLSPSLSLVLSGILLRVVCDASNKNTNQTKNCWLEVHCEGCPSFHENESLSKKSFSSSSSCFLVLSSHPLLNPICFSINFSLSLLPVDLFWKSRSLLVSQTEKNASR